MIIATDVVKLSEIWVPIIVQLVITSGAIFGSAGFWQWKSAREQAKRDAESKKTGIENKVSILSEHVMACNDKIDSLSAGLQEIKDDVVLLQAANEETVKYREARDKQDAESLKAQRAVIESMKGLLRDRLLEVYKSCTEKGYYSREERETYGELFKCYESEPFDGNGIMHQLQPIMKALPWTAEDAEKERNKDEVIV